MTYSGVESAASCHCLLSEMLCLEAICPDFGAVQQQLPGTEWPGWLSQLPKCQDISLHQTAEVTLDHHWG